MHALVHLGQATVPKILLTATLVPSQEKVLAKFVGISLRRTLILRSPIARPNHELHITAVPPPCTPLSVGVQLASLLLETWKDDPAVRGIIFVRTINMMTEVAQSAPFPVCKYSGAMIRGEKDTQLGSWFSNENPAKWMVSTTALLHGVDYPRVDAVIFVEPPFGLYDLVQGAGRAGRTGQPSFIAVLHQGPSGPMANENEYSCREEMELILESETCRRAGISNVMDGDEIPCSQLTDSLPCDFCQGRTNPLIAKAINASKPTPARQKTATQAFTLQPPPRPPPTAQLAGYTAQDNAEARRKHAQSVKDLMQRFSGCFTCRIKSNNHRPCHEKCGNTGASGCSDTPHLPYTCTTFSYKNGWIDWRKASLQWPKDIYRCHFCGLPSNVAGNAHDEKDGKYPGKCQFSDAAVTAAWHILHSPELFEKLQRELGFTPGVDVKASFGSWLVTYQSPREDLPLLSVFSWLCRQYYPETLSSR